MKKGFTLIELLIVVAIIAILAAIAVPNFLEAQIRSKVSRARSDMRSLATGIESYYVDNNQYPASAKTGGSSLTWKPAQPAGVGPYNQYVQGAQAFTSDVWSFSAQQATVSGGAAKMASMTTPISYITSYFVDPFKDTRSATFYYYNDTNGWILWSCGPDADEATRSNLGLVAASNAVETVYQSAIAQPSNTLIAGQGNTNRAFTYDPTNGTVSPGDVWRVKQ